MIDLTIPIMSILRVSTCTHPLQSTTRPSSKYHTTLFKVPHHPIQSTTPPSSKYYTTLFKVLYHPLQSTTPPSSKYHTNTHNVNSACFHMHVSIKIARSRRRGSSQSGQPRIFNRRKPKGT